jgi:23S rRNA (adenine2503-C2)-methyltransferase
VLEWVLMAAPIAQVIWLDEAARRAGYADLAAFATSHGLKKYRLAQLYRAATRELVDAVGSVTVLPKELRSAFEAEGFGFDSVEPVVVQHSTDKQTIKGLFRLTDGNAVEAVLMQHRGGRNTVCISSQSGCAYACAFCATGQAGFTRHLSAAEIFDQARYFARLLRARDAKITNIVFMGMGEPFHNYAAVMDAVRLLNDPHGFGLGHRHITISTVGIVPQIDAFADEGIQVNLAISLHAATDEVRSSIMPVNRKWNIDELMAACKRYIAKTNRKIFFEYVMLDGVNDRLQDAQALAALMHGPLYHVNIIPYNSTPDANLGPTGDERIRAFAAILEAKGVPCTVRTPMGRDIAAACGQLRAETRPRAKAG